MFNLKSIRIKSLLFVILITTILVALFSIITFDIIVSDKKNQINETLSFRSLDLKKTLDEPFDKNLLVFAILENTYYQDPEKIEQEAFSKQFTSLLAVKVDGAQKGFLYNPRKIGDEVFEGAAFHTITSGKNEYSVRLSGDKKILQIQKDIFDGKSKFNSYFDFSQEFDVLSYPAKQGGGYFVFDSQGSILFQNINHQTSPDVFSQIASQNKSIDNLIIKGVKVGDESFVSACDKLKSGFTICHFMSEKITESLIYYLSFQYLVYFLAILSVIGILIMFILKRFTAPLEDLTKNAVEIAKGNFEVKNEVKSKDEIGKLSMSFNYMTQKLIEYIAEVKEKARMQEELVLAETVQGYFFPNNEVQKVRNIEVKGIHHTASECGGDWWGIKEIDKYIVLFIGDATGHGVPSALITSAVYSCVNLLPDFYRNNPTILEPENIMNLLNKTVHSLGQEILMTFFVAVIDADDLSMRYSNASHNFPFLVNQNTKKSQILQSTKGRRLGENLESTYETANLQLERDDVFLLYTDGITESVNPKGRMYGEKRLLRQLKKFITLSPQEIIEKFLQDVDEYSESAPPDDDITMACLRVL